KDDMKSITNRNGTAYPGPMIPTTSSSSPVVECVTEATKDTVHHTHNGSIEDVQPLVVPTESPILDSDPVISPIIEPVASLVSSPSASINLMPLFVWNKLSFLSLSPTCMTLELVDRLISCPVGLSKDVFVKVGTFHFLTDFVVVDFDADPRVPLILKRSFLKTGRALIDMFKGELTLRVGKKAITFNLDQTSRYSANYNDMTENRIDVIDMACEEYSQEVLVVENEENELILTRLVTGWRVCINYRKLNEATRKDHFPLPFMDQMLERLAGNQYYCFLDGFS
nr:reverse transcriptase domain-containing protein [Tanacetum cinerariifolium]